MLEYNIHELVETTDPNVFHNLKYFMTKNEICLPIKFYGKPYTVRINSSLGQERINGLFRLYFTFVKERESRNMCLSTLRENDVFIDVGASVGSWSLPAAAFGASVIAIEPDIESLDILYNQIKSNHFEDRIKVIEKFAGSDLTIDSLGLDNVKLIKIDVEGVEFDVLSSAKETIKKYNPNIMVELHTFANQKSPQDEIEFITKINSKYQTKIISQKVLEENQEHYHLYHYI